MSDLDLTSAVAFVASAGMVVGGVIPYVPQYLEIKRTRNADGFSLYVCLTLLLANTLRIYFWFGHPFELPLLIQSIVMIAAMFAMIHLCTHVKRQSSIVPTRNRSFTDSPESQIDLEKHQTLVSEQHKFTDFDPRYFWQWTDCTSYFQFIALYAGGVGLLTYVFLQTGLSLFFEALGFISLFTEAMLAIPQFLKNWKTGSTKGMSVSMVLLWTGGDLLKTAYFILRAAPVQFSMCGIIQVTVDFCILTQVVHYRD